MPLIRLPKALDPEVEAGPDATSAITSSFTWQQVALVGLVIVVSTLVVHLTAACTEFSAWRGQGFPDPAESPVPALFRFDSVYYLDIAQNGYSYDGDLYSSPNIVFFPTYPVLIRALMVVSPLSALTAGMVVSWLCMALGTWFVWLVMRRYFGTTAAWFTAIGLHLAPGTFSLHAYYSESTMLLFLALSFYFLQRRQHLPQLIAVAALGATRPTAVVFCGIFALYFAWLAWQGWREGKRGAAARFLVYAPLTFAGLGAYLLYVHVQWGNPFSLMPAIKHASWGSFHRPVPIISALVPWQLIGYIPDLLSSERFFLFNFRATNWLCLTFALIAGWWALLRLRPIVFVSSFLAYVLWITYNTVGSPLLISMHRHMVLMLPLYLLVWAGRERLLQAFKSPLPANAAVAVIVLIGLAYRLTYTSAFVAGIWFYF